MGLVSFKEIYNDKDRRAILKEFRKVRSVGGATTAWLREMAENRFIGHRKYSVRREAYKRMHDGRKCEVCGEKAQVTHHIVPVLRGGNGTPNNLIALCHNCHEEVHEWMKPKPEAPLKKISETAGWIWTTKR